ncbi:surface antigen family protein [Ehrlichia chaffeensis str. Heartland]|uniref:P44/Msp2 family outer membrane protein n=1 Tax=Ehrlichia chaffeensis TaxID=945 RepID=UPI000444C15E|nr:P44/Msp2 family outer membrane protein [Ehrlichia chaffeensis]AHX03219.1 surface antigen family protein [Ehrlichia chaffeensis str. Heartland]AHX10753.1 surface antigen family protein [Ehrlichia chaffeensis str. West Paces]
MNYKKFVVGVALATLLSFLPDNSFSDANVPEGRKGFYVGTQYKVGVPNFSNFSAEETLPGLTKKIFALGLDKSGISSHSNFTQAYNPTYASNFAGFGGVIGYYVNDFRVEFEGAYENFEPERQWYPEGGESHKFFALSRESTVQDNKFIVLENDGVIDRSLNVNFCYDIAHGSIPLAPYMCAGVGADYVKFLGISLPKFSYQVKFGVNYPVSVNVMLFGGGYYHKVIGNRYERVEIAYHPAGLSEHPKTTSASATLDTDYFGWEVGMRFTL